ncbi:glycoside hydrolase family 64 protein [Acrodontium crateriforme]|uniref:Glycoside hydrolase family 64 protein n=1 Tax=Acrodontium crateriforme TaxID=150365 RepID=A0AAQ3LWR2_9PEZI|nr:glycoside hydrolase family 64 protein [Acrodontium crateriforme]
MGTKLYFAVIASAIISDLCVAGPIEARPVAPSRVVVSSSNTLNSTRPGRISNNIAEDIALGLPGLPQVSLKPVLPGLLGSDPLSLSIPIPLLNPSTPTSTPAPKSNSTGSSNTTVNSGIHASSPLGLSFVNHRQSSNLTAYVTGLDPDGQLVILQSNGQFYKPICSSTSGVPEPITADIAIPLGGPGSTTTSSIPDYLTGSRIWFAEGKLNFFTVPGDAGANLVEPSATDANDPSANVSWGFVELTWMSNYGIFADISYVDFVGLPLGIDLKSGDNSVQTAQGLPADAVQRLCDDLKTQGDEDGYPWADLCIRDITGRPLRVLAPGNYLNRNPGAFDQFWKPYVDKVWDQFSQSNLTVITQAAAGNVSCSVQSNGTMTCAGDNRCYEKPTANDIFGCNSGPFAIQTGDNDVHKAVVPRLCAAFNRGTLLLSGGEVQPSLNSKLYYTEKINNWYSSIVHKHELDGRGYAFPYDDVVPDGGTDQAGTVMNPDPKILTITIGGPSVA